MKIPESIIRSPRKERRELYHGRKRRDPAENWEDYRRWDGGKPTILKGFDVLRAREERKKAEREAAAAGPGGRFFGTMGGALKGLTRHRMFRATASPESYRTRTWGSTCM